MNERKTFGFVCHPTSGANMTSRDTEFIQSHAPLSIFLAYFWFVIIFLLKIQKPIDLSRPFLVLQLCSGKGDQYTTYMSVCLCPVTHVCRQFDCSSCMSGRSGPLRLWGREGIDAAFQSEWPAEENNKARMTGTDGLLYCPLKCKHWISLLGGWHHYIFIFSLLSLSPLIALVAGTHPHLRLKGLIEGWSQMLIIGCLRFNGQWHRTKMTRGGTNVQAVGYVCTTDRAFVCKTRNSTASQDEHYVFV